MDKNTNQPVTSLRITVHFPPNSPLYKQINEKSRGKMDNAAFIRMAVSYYLEQIEKGKVIF